jgi:hypothetical protein
MLGPSFFVHNGALAGPLKIQVELHPYHNNYPLVRYCQANDIHVTAYRCDCVCASDSVCQCDLPSSPGSSNHSIGSNSYLTTPPQTTLCAARWARSATGNLETRSSSTTRRLTRLLRRSTAHLRR